MVKIKSKWCKCCLKKGREESKPNQKTKNYYKKFNSYTTKFREHFLLKNKSIGIYDKNSY